MIYDEEEVIKALEAIYKADLNTEIASVNTDKGLVGDDAIPTIANDKYVFETLTKNVLNYLGYFVFYGLEDTQPLQAQASSFVDKIDVSFWVCTFDDGEQDLREKFYKLLRYRRALKQVILKNADVFQGYATPLVASLEPDAFPLSSKRVILRAGIKISASISTN